MILKVGIVVWLLIFVVYAGIVDALDRIRDERHRREMRKIYNNFDDLMKDVEKTLGKNKKRG